MSPIPLPAVLDLPPMEAPVTVVGDVHLSEHDPAVAARFSAFLATVPEGSTLILLGDLFDWWVGRAQARLPFARGTLDRLREVASRGVRLAFLGGNRDFAFDGARNLAIEIWPDVVRTRWGDRTVVLSHGDLLCTADERYLRMRRVFRSPAARSFLRLSPFALTSRMARGARRISTADMERKSPTEVGLDYGEARRWLDGYDADALVLGHVHTGVHHRLEGDRPRDVYVLEDWARHANAITFDGAAIRLEAHSVD